MSQTALTLPLAGFRIGVTAARNIMGEVVEYDYSDWASSSPGGGAGFAFGSARTAVA